MIRRVGRQADYRFTVWVLWHGRDSRRYRLLVDRLHLVTVTTELIPVGQWRRGML